MQDRKRGSTTRFGLGLLTAAILSAAFFVFAAGTVPTDVQQPGTQPGEGPPISSSCSCHYGTDNPEIEPGYGWEGGMMSNAMRDPLFWATVAIAEQDFLPGVDPAQRGGVGDLCLRCHGPRGWLGGNSVPTDGSAYVGDEDRGVECEFCHQLVDPDQPVNIPGTTEAQTAPFEAFDPDTGEGYYGSGQYVMEGSGTRLGPYSDAVANHSFLQSSFHRQGEFCGTCHDVSNPAVGDLAHNFGAQVGLGDGYSGVPGGPVEEKAAFNHAPYKYGIVERTFSEWKAGGLDTYRVDEYANLPAGLLVPNGALDLAYHRAFDVVPPSANPNRPNYEDGTVRYFTCQTCHMAASTGKGCDKNQAPTRYDLPRHDQTGGGYWMPDVVLYQNDNGLLRVGSISADQRAAMLDGKSRAGAWLSAASSLSASQVAEQLHVRVTNLTGHKLISGYPEGRRMWLNVEWYDAASELIHEDGAYGPIGRTVADLSETPHPVESILDLDGTVVYQADPGMDQQWAGQLISLGYDPNLALTYDRQTDAVEMTLSELAGSPAGTAKHTFHFVLNNVLLHDNRIPPYGFSYDDARDRSCLPVPETLYGDPGPGDTYDYWDDQYFEIPVGAVTAEVTLYYQQTSWEYIQFLWLQNDGLGPFLGNEGVNMLDAWLNTGMSQPWEMAEATAVVEASCVPIAPDDATCDGVDDDCDGQVDEDYMSTGTTCGVGECEGNSGELICQDGVEVDSCDPFAGASPDICDGLDNDCNAATEDGSDESWLGQECDGPDSDLCTEGVYECSAGAQSCTDATTDDLDLCDGADNDCNAATEDGSDEPWLGQECDGPDSDLCTEGVYECSAGTQSCTDATTDDLDLCDGADNDCNAATEDGSDEPWLGQECDGPDSDLCTEGVYECSAGTQSCTDATTDDLDLCDGADNDCNAATEDGSDEPWLGQECDGSDSDLCTEGVYECSAGAQSCTDATTDDLDLCDGADNDCNAATEDGSDEPWLGQECDGPDSDLCTEGVYECSAGAQSCTDATTDDLDLCDGADNDCNAATEDGSDELWLGQECDGSDSDLCTEGVYECSAGAQSCTDATSDDLDLCDGLDNDCNAATEDGSDEPWLGQECDGPDSDLCTEGVYECSAGAQSCTDATTDDLDLCDGADNDCNAATEDGSDEPWLEQECDGPDSDLCTEGVYECSAGAQSCTDATTDDLDLCDGADNDCNAATEDGSDEPWLEQECDGPDSDLCTEGVYECSAGAQSCTDATTDDLDLCDGADNDCNAATEDGSDEPWLEQECDGPDSDLCTEGVYECSAGTQSCTDATSDDLDLCDGLDNDCNAATEDGSVEPWLGQECDGPDADLCTEGVYECSAGTQSCTDATTDDLDLCDGADNDCNAATEDGSDEPWFGQECDGPDSDLCTEGVYECSAGTQSCTDATTDDLDLCDGADNDCNAATGDGSNEPWLGQECDGPDSDLCTEGVYECSAGAQSCSDVSGDDVEVCDGADNDCDDAIDEGLPVHTYWQDSDGDEHGNPDVTLETCQETPPDGYVDQANDCNDNDGSAWEIPGEVMALAFGPSSETLSWMEPSVAGGTSPAYDALRSGIPNDFTGDSVCVESDDDTDTTAIDTETPAPDTAWFYLIRAENSCGDGSLGQASDTSLRHGRACP